MEILDAALAVIHVLAATAWIGGMIFHIAVLDPVFRNEPPDGEAARLLVRMEGRFRRLVATSIALIAGSGAVRAWLLVGSPGGLLSTATGRFVLLKIALLAAMLAIFAVCPKTKGCSPIRGVCEVASGKRGAAGRGEEVRERSRVVLPKVALALGILALAAGVISRG